MLMKTTNPKKYSHVRRKRPAKSLVTQSVSFIPAQRKSKAGVSYTFLKKVVKQIGPKPDAVPNRATRRFEPVKAILNARRYGKAIAAKENRPAKKEQEKNRKLYKKHKRTADKFGWHKNDKNK